MRRTFSWWRLSIVGIAGVLGVTFSLARADHHEKTNGSAGALSAIVAGAHRSEADKARDKYRHPLETLTWLGIKDNMTVVEVWPGRGGWYTDILAPFLKERGTYYAAGVDPQSSVEGQRTAAKSFKDKLAANPALFGNVKESILVATDTCRHWAGRIG